jgi:hypothetical protein
MKNRKTLSMFNACVLAGIMALSSCSKESTKAQMVTESMIYVPIGGNAYVVSTPDGGQIEDEGLTKWYDKNTKISAWFKTDKAGKLDVALRAKSDTKSVLTVTVEGESFDVEVKADDWTSFPVGSVTLKEAGYVRIDLQGKSKTGQTFAEVSNILIGGDAAKGNLNYVTPETEFYWARRGPSVHFGYTQPDEDCEYFYNEVTVPNGSDIIGSYYMSNGFSEGYFGMQANSEDTRRVLFSVWSPYDTENPDDIPENMKIKMLRKGENVHIGEFGNEGSGGQSYLNYMWKTGNTYSFLTRVRPDGNGNTLYTSYFYAPEENKWMLIASFLRPETNTWYKGAHSFLENFMDTQGYLTRQVTFGNQWIRTVKGEWVELCKATFTCDNTGRSKVRMDYTGGVTDEGRFFLKNCGFFNENTEYRSVFERPSLNKAPQIDLEALEKI